MNLTATITINRPASEVFDYVMEVRHDAQWRSGVVEASLPGGRSTRVRYGEPAATSAKRPGTTRDSPSKRM